ncbi:hypothetical protein FOMPIDRAFT_95148, partial [Fomitopsis schrenkii]
QQLGYERESELETYKAMVRDIKCVSRECWPAGISLVGVMLAEPLREDPRITQADVSKYYHSGSHAYGRQRGPNNTVPPPPLHALADVIAFVGKMHGEEPEKLTTLSGGSTGGSASPFYEFYPGTP